MANLCRTPKPSRTPVLGKRYVREWDGVRHEVILLEDGRAVKKAVYHTLLEERVQLPRYLLLFLIFFRCNAIVSVLY